VTHSTASLWVETTPPTTFSELRESVAVDVAVLGGGIAGITTAVLLKRAGKTVAVIDSRRVVRGATGYTTAKVTAGHGVIYSHLERQFGLDGARLYAQANQAAIDRIAAFVDEHTLDCDFERKANYVYAETASERTRLQDEAEAARRAGLPASFVAEVPLPYAVAGAVRLDDQAQFHPRKYLLPLARSLPGEGSYVFESTPVLSVNDDSPCVVLTESGEVRADRVVCATHLPILDRGLFFAKAHPHRSYAVAARVERDRLPDGMFINVGTPTRSLRTSRDERGPLLLVGGEGHKPGEEPDTERRYRALEEFARRHFGATEFPYRWSTMDFMSVDRVPYIGRLTRRSDRIYAATGFNKWGMTSGTVAAMIIADAILGRDNPWSTLYEAKRLKVRASAARFVRENGIVGLRFVGDRLRRAREGDPAELRPGEGRLMVVDGRQTAVYRADDGTLHALSPVCKHLGCIVAWNPAERSWDCPCHGSRYSGEGKVLTGPAVRNLDQRELGRS
jgi:glycine/D-amino acid oxidase-like deaminating enzyme/nitrite reductase/ring-hydroxylating ferredoxin subunit